MMSLIIFALIFLLVVHAFEQNETQFIYNGFKGSINKLHVNGDATILPNGLLQMTDYTAHEISHAFYPHPINFKPNHLSFSTTFAFSMYPQVPNHSGHGIAFVISPSTDFKHAIPSHLGLVNDSSNGLSSNHILAIELDTFQNIYFEDIDGNHVGIDVNSLHSIDAASASYYSDKKGVNKTLLLNSGKPMQIWIEYDEMQMLVNVTLAPLGNVKPSKCLLSKHINLSTILLESMYVGFSSSTGLVSNCHYILGWSWNQSGRTKDLDFLKLQIPLLPQIDDQKLSLNQLDVVLLVIVILLLLLMIVVVNWFIWRKKFKHLQEPWERYYTPHRFSYKDLLVATKGFRSSEILGVGGFGIVYKGVLPSTCAQVAVKRISHNSKQGMKEFVAEISCMKRLRHRNLVQLLGYCKRKGELILVYDYMPNGSLDKFLFNKIEKTNLRWSLRFRIIKGVASALLYLHEEWEQVVIHRDVKASNVLLDSEMNARLGDFGLAKLYSHSIDPRTTHLVGTIGYIAPEASKTRKPTTSTDVFSFGMFLLEVGCGRRPTGKEDDEDDAKALFLSDWVYNCWKRGEILKASDPRLEGNYEENEMELILKLGLLCLHPKAEARPKIRQAVQFLNGSVALPDIPPEYNIQTSDFFGRELGTLQILPSSSGNSCLGVMSSTNSVLEYGR